LLFVVRRIDDRSVLERHGNSGQRSTRVGSAAIGGGANSENLPVGSYETPSVSTQAPTDHLEADSANRARWTNDLDRLTLGQHGIELTLGHVDLGQLVVLHVSHHAPRLASY